MTDDARLQRRLDELDAKADAHTAMLALLISKAAGPVDPDEERLLRPLLPVIGEAEGVDKFFTSDLYRWREGRSAEAAKALEIALKATGLNSNRLGIVFGRCVGRAIGGFVIVSTGTDAHRGVKAWRVIPAGMKPAKHAPMHDTD